MLSGISQTALIHGLRPSIGPSWDLSVTPVADSLAISKPGLYEIVNLGPDPCYMIMLSDSATATATTNDYILSPLGSGDKCRHEVLVSSADKNNFRDIDNVLHAIAAAGKATTLRITRVSVV